VSFRAALNNNITIVISTYRYSLAPPSPLHAEQALFNGQLDALCVVFSALSLRSGGDNIIKFTELECLEGARRRRRAGQPLAPHNHIITNHIVMCRPFFAHTIRNAADAIFAFRRRYSGETSTVIRTPATDADDCGGCFLEMFRFRRRFLRKPYYNII